MNARVLQTNARIDFGDTVPTILMLGAAANALVVRIMEAVGTGGLSADLGITPFQIMILFVAARLSLGSGDAGRPRASLLVDALTLALVLVPSSAVSWLALAFYASLHAARATGERRQGALLFVALALTALWSSVALKFIAAPVTTSEAFVVGKLVGLLRPDIVQSANIIGNPQTHSLVLMTRCTTLDALPSAIVSMAGVALLLGPPDVSRAWRAAAMLAIVLFVANVLRLSAMSWSAEAYAIVHGPVGANIFDGLQAVLVLALGNWVSSA